MHANHANLLGVNIFEPQVFHDERGFFMEAWNRGVENPAPGVDFVQDNHSRSARGVLRGLHYQIERPQGKLVWVVRGEIFDVAVDLRRHSPTFGKWMSVLLGERNHRQVYWPPGLAHGFCVVSDEADVLYKCTEPYAPQCERTLLWNDPEIGIEWPISQPILSAKDRLGHPLRGAEPYE